MPTSEGELFRRILGAAWQELHPDIRQRFDRHPAPDQPLCYTGTLDQLGCSRFGKLLGLLSRPFLKGALIPVTDTDVPVDIAVFTKPGSPKLYKSRLYCLNGRRPVRFTSYMLEGRHGECLEFVGFGLGMKLRLHVEDGQLHFTSDGYFLNLFGLLIPIPEMLTPGTTYLSHCNDSATQFNIRIEIVHRLFGRTFWQMGSFTEQEYAP